MIELSGGKMKTRIIIDIETEFKKIFEGDDDGMATSVECTQEEEERFHKFVKQIIEEVLNEDLDDDYFERFSYDFGVEGYDSFDDYGKIKFEISKQDDKQELQAKD